ncbi:hypothetical protein PVK06_018795 [Gossypium arboreum]|uniref:RNase H type-1 domain-containing protein n=1 Tax=Gossypium arboreum TaxID=29729 RepID=A0ABR0PHX3_GOSAR|nr:hypothetical protein PVK06_018795 [Gossypium arboreum]
MNVLSKLWNASGNSRLGMAKRQPPNLGWIKINTDGAANTDENWLAAGGVLRAFSENWVRGCQRFIGRGSTVNSELWVILHGLEIVQNRRSNKIIIEIDCMMAVEIMIKEG